MSGPTGDHRQRLNRYPGRHDASIARPRRPSSAIAGNAGCPPRSAHPGQKLSADVAPTRSGAPALVRSLARGALTWRRPLRAEIDGIERLACGHEQPVALGSPKANIAAYLGQADAADQFAFGCPDGDPAIADRPACIARTPQVAVD